MEKFKIDEDTIVEVDSAKIEFSRCNLFWFEEVYIPLDKWVQVKEFIDNNLKSKK